MLKMLALPVVRENLDDPALRNPTVVAGDHGLEFVPQGREPCDLVFHLVEMSLGDVMHLTAGTVGVACEPQELPDRLNLEAELAGMTDEVEPADVPGTVPPLLALGPGRLGQQADLLVVADGGDFHVGLPGQIANRQGHQKPLEPLAVRGCKVVSTRNARTGR